MKPLPGGQPQSILKNKARPILAMQGPVPQRLTLDPPKTIDSGSGSPGNLPTRESCVREQNKCVFFIGKSPNIAKQKDHHLKEANLQPQRRHHHTKYDTPLPKHHKNVDSQPIARSAARNRAAKCTWRTTKKAGDLGAELTPRLCDCKGL